MRRSRAGLKRIGLLALALVVALGALGVAYSAWTDSVYINGTVQTGTVDVNVIQCTSTFVYKVPGAQVPGLPPDTVVVYASGHEPPISPPAGGILVSSALVNFVNSGSDADTATMTFSGLFPGIDVKADLKMQYFGTIPVKVSIASIGADRFQDAIIDNLWALGEATKNDTTRMGAWVDGDLTTFTSKTTTTYNNMLGVQLHQFDTIHITLHVRLPQDAQYQNLAGVRFVGHVTVVQWNEYGMP